MYMKIIVNGIVWKIKYTHNRYDLSRDDGTLTWGVTDRSTQEIFIYDRLSPYMRQKVLTHELVHAWIFSYGIYLDVEQEEFVCSFIDTYAREIIAKADEVLANTYRKNIL